MDRRTFLQTAGLGVLGATAGCSLRLAQDRPQPVPRGGPWRQATGGAGNTATAPYPDSTTEGWSTPIPGSPATPPVVANESAVVGTPDGTVLALDLATGAEQWRRQTAGVQGAPVILGELVVVPGDDGRLHRVSLWNGESLVDPLAVGTSMRSPVTLADGRVFALASPGTLVAVDVRDWSVAWSVDVATRPVGKPAVADGLVVIAGERRDGRGQVQVFDAEDGEERWHVQTAKGLSQTAVFDGDRILVAGGHGNTVTSSPVEDDPDPAGVFWFDTDGRVQRTAPLGPPIWSRCAVRYLGLRDGWATVSGCNGLVAHGPDDAVWSTTQPQGIVTRPLQTPGGVFVGDAHGQFWLVGADGRERVLAVDGIPTTPAVLDYGMVVAAGRRVYGFT